MFFISLLNVEYFCMSVRAQDAPLCGLWEGLRRLMTLRHFSIYISSWVIIAVEMKFGKHILPEPTPLELPPHHFIHHAHVTLDDAHDLG